MSQEQGLTLPLGQIPPGIYGYLAVLELTRREQRRILMTYGNTAGGNGLGSEAQMLLLNRGHLEQWDRPQPAISLAQVRGR